MPVLKLTQNLIDHGLQCPVDSRRVELCCEELQGLYVEVRATRPGQGTFYLRYKDGNGTTRHQKIARTSDMSLADARKKAKELKARIALGADPRGEAEARKAVLTLTEFFHDHYLPYVASRKRTWKKDAEIFRLRLEPEFGNKRLNQIARHQVQEVHTGWRQQGLAAATCNHGVKLLRHALNLAVDWQMLALNPIARVELFREDNKVENYLKPEELARLLAVLKSHRNRPVCQIALFLLSTGARLNEALRATWSQIDRANRVWRIPAENSKSKKVRSVPLNDTALVVLSQLKTEGEFEHLFVNRRTGLPYANVHKVWERLRAQAGVPWLRLHDLRHGFASFMVNSGRTLYEVQHILGHSDPSVTQRYAHLSTATLQEASGSASRVIEEAMPTPR